MRGRGGGGTPYLSCIGMCGLNAVFDTFWSKIGVKFDKFDLKKCMY